MSGLCVGCEGEPAPENNPCAVCGQSSPDLAKEVERLRETLEEIANRHIGDQPAADGGDELDWAVRQHTALRAIARQALNPNKER